MPCLWIETVMCVSSRISKTLVSTLLAEGIFFGASMAIAIRIPRRHFTYWRPAWTQGIVHAFWFELSIHRGVFLLLPLQGRRDAGPHLLQWGSFTCTCFGPRVLSIQIARGAWVGWRRVVSILPSSGSVAAWNLWGLLDKGILSSGRICVLLSWRWKRLERVRISQRRRKRKEDEFPCSKNPCSSGLCNGERTAFWGRFPSFKPWSQSDTGQVS